MLVPLTLIHLGLLISSLVFKLSYYEFVVASIVNSSMLLIIICRFGAKYAMIRLMCGEIMPLYLYMVWLYAFPQPEYIYIIPLFLSSLGKTYLMCTSPSSLDIDAVESLIKMQAKVEIIIFVHHIIKCLSNGLPSLVI